MRAAPYPPLLAALRAGDSAALLALLEAGADPETPDPQMYGVPALHTAACLGEVTAARLLLEHGAAVDIADITGESALTLAVRCGKQDAAVLLLERGADLRFSGRNQTVPAADARGSTPFHALIEQSFFALRDQKWEDLMRDSAMLIFLLDRDPSLLDEFAQWRREWLAQVRLVGVMAAADWPGKFTQRWRPTLLIAADAAGHPELAPQIEHAFQDGG